MRRREFVLGLGFTVGWSSSTRAQQSERVRRIGALFGGAGVEAEQTWFAALVHRLDELGWKQGRNVQIELRWGNGDAERLRANAAELLAWYPDVIFVFNNLALAELKPLVRDVPIVFAGVGDPIGDGFVASLSRPGGNITGFESFAPTMGGKWLEVLKQAVPHVNRVLALMHEETAAHRGFWQSMQEGATRLSIDVSAASVHNPAEITEAILSFATTRDGGVISFPHAVTNANSKLIVELEMRYRLPGLYTGSVDGSLVSYGIDWPDQMRRSADYIDRILRGASPADLPVQAPTRYLLTVNLKAAKAIGADVSPSILLLADEVIE